MFKEYCSFLGKNPLPALVLLLSIFGSTHPPLLESYESLNWTASLGLWCWCLLGNHLTVEQITRFAVTLTPSRKFFSSVLPSGNLTLFILLCSTVANMYVCALPPNILQIQSANQGLIQRGSLLPPENQHVCGIVMNSLQSHLF